MITVNNVSLYYKGGGSESCGGEFYLIFVEQNF
ncbi:hypothetical protein VAMP_44n3 [Candidatus Vampirococcus lugosii]|uniref:ABC transporter ATP-binding protein n=1 Tax=Candidatus Vampirococcus lugosii TaxID=2789015 RepID=A0ABS5QLV7_9BACT|nr:hypothetical protein [Candidatus Vampirococcus lugosii]